MLVGLNLEDDEKDTSETDSKESEDKDSDTEDDSDDSSDDSQAEDTEDEDTDEDITKQYFTDPKSLDPKLRGAFKKMQAAFTRKMQAASASLEKSRAFDLLVTDPEFRQWMEDRKRGIVNKKSKGRTAARNDEDDDSNEDDEDKPLTRRELLRIMDDRDNHTRQQNQEAEWRAEAREFKKDHPDWQIYKDDILQAIEKHPSFSFEEAYEWATRGETKSNSKKNELRSKKGANINKPSRTTGREVDKKGVKMTIAQAFELAKRQKGIKE